MRIHSGFTPEIKGATAAEASDSTSRGDTRRWQLRPGYALALVWVVVGFSLYAFQVVKLVSGVG
jgi:hypothetical protein